MIPDLANLHVKRYATNGLKDILMTVDFIKYVLNSICEYKIFQVRQRKPSSAFNLSVVKDFENLVTSVTNRCWIQFGPKQVPANRLSEF